MEKIDFLMVLHNHQPCDNFGWVFDEAYTKSYEPFLNVLERYPRVKVIMHYSGSLLEWLLKNKPDFINRIKSLVKKRQITLLTGGFYEPIFPVIPDCDKIGQLGLLTEFIKNYFEYNPKGLWITERVWQKDLADLFLNLGLEYSIVDENHLRKAGVPREDIGGYYKLHNGFKVFASSKLLRYIIPFADMNEIARHFRKLCTQKGSKCIVFADDGEKFGFWPYTYEWVYKKRWLEKFFEFLSDDKSPARTITFQEALDKFAPSGEVDIPPSSYSEMMEWSKGDFNNFFKIYPEANIMRNRMLDVSERIKDADSQIASTSKQKSLIESARRELYKAQSGCAYWHGVFGGLYLSHLRAGIYKHLINAQKLLDELSVCEKVFLKTCDLDGDKDEEIIIGNKYIDLYIKPQRLGSIFELDNKKKSCNMINIITRKHESYHSKLFGRKKSSLKDIEKSIQNDKYINIHDVLGLKDKGLKKFLIYDKDKKNSMLDYFFGSKYSFRDFLRGDQKNLIEISNGPDKIDKIIDKDFISFMLEKKENIKFGNSVFPIYIKKEFTVSNSPEFYIEYTIKNLSREKLTTTFATEFNWSFMNKYFLKMRDFKQIDSFLLRDEWSDIEIRYRFNEFLRLWTTPIYTLNETEKGLAKTYQYLCMLFQKPILLRGDESKKLNITVTVDEKC